MDTTASWSGSPASGPVGAVVTCWWIDAEPRLNWIGHPAAQCCSPRPGPGPAFDEVVLIEGAGPAASRCWKPAATLAALVPGRRHREGTCHQRRKDYAPAADRHPRRAGLHGTSHPGREDRPGPATSDAREQGLSIMSSSLEELGLDADPTGIRTSVSNATTPGRVGLVLVKGRSP